MIVEPEGCPILRKSDNYDSSINPIDRFLSYDNSLEMFDY